MKSELNFILRQARGNEAYKQIRWAENIMLVISIMYPSVPFFFNFEQLLYPDKKEIYYDF
jgi:hypothetical protein